MTPAGTSNELDVQNEWEEHTTHTHYLLVLCYMPNPSRETKFSGTNERGQGNIHFSCSADHVQDWQPYPVDPCSCYMCDHTYIHGAHVRHRDYGIQLTAPDSFVTRLEKRQQRLRKNEETAVYLHFIRLNNKSI